MHLQTCGFSFYCDKFKLFRSFTYNLHVNYMFFSEQQRKENEIPTIASMQ